MLKNCGSNSDQYTLAFVKLELSENLGIFRLNERLSDPTMQDSFESIFPRDNPKNTRFSINFFTSIGLGGITENLREYLKNMPRIIMQQQRPVSDESGNSSSGASSSSSGSSESESSSSDSSESETESESDDDKRRKRRRDDDRRRKQGSDDRRHTHRRRRE